MVSRFAFPKTHGLYGITQPARGVAFYRNEKRVQTGRHRQVLYNYPNGSMVHRGISHPGVAGTLTNHPPNQIQTKLTR